MPAPDPYAAAQTFLAAVVAAWDGKPLPKTRYVSEGALPPWDGEQVTVAIGALRPGLPGSQSVTARPARVFPVSAELTVQIIRTRGAGLTRQGGRQTALPDAAKDRTAGAAAGADLTALLAALLAIRENGSVVSNPTKIAVNGTRPLGPDGDLVGVEGTVVVLLGH